MARTSTKQDEDFLGSVISQSLLEESIAWMQQNMSPEEVFTHDQLWEWAKSNGYVVEDE